MSRDVFSFISANFNTFLRVKIHFYSLHHSLTSLLAQKSGSLYIIKELLGRENLATTQTHPAFSDGITVTFRRRI